VPVEEAGVGRIWFGTSTDIEEQRRDKELLQQADRMKDEFLATLAHELRNPLAPLTTGLQLIKMDAGNAETVKRAQALTIAKKLVELHGGPIEAHSDGLGIRSRFTVQLPAVLHVVCADAATAAQRDARPNARRILIADDNRDAAITLALLLELQGHETQTAYDGVEALQIAETFRPDIAVLDIGMPKLNGYDVCQQLREHPWGRSMTMVALTGWGQSQDKQRAREAGFDLHLVKPVNPDMLAEVLSAGGKADDSAQKTN
jgi:CheY-like chemotaxis protein